jgi:hypothetical protein
MFRDILDRRLDGRLTLVDERGQRHELTFVTGVPVALNSPITIEPLPTTLLKLGLITPSERRRLAGFDAGDEELARHLVEQGVVRGRHIEGALRHRLALRVERLTSLGPPTRFVIRCDARRRPDGARPCNVLALLMRGFRRLARSPRGREVLDALGGREIAVRAEADLRFVGLSRTECQIVDSLDAAAATLDELRELGIGPAPTVDAAIYALVELRMIDIGFVERPVTMPPLDSFEQPTVPELFVQAEKQFRRRKLDEAEGLLMRLLSLDPHHLGAQALVAWLRAQRIGTPKLVTGQTSMIYAGPLDLLDAVVRADPSFERARYWRGQLLKRSGFLREAQLDFKAVTRLNPRNIGAQREVRRYEMSQRRRDEPSWSRWMATRRR